SAFNTRPTAGPTSFHDQSQALQGFQSTAALVRTSSASRGTPLVIRLDRPRSQRPIERFRVEKFSDSRESAADAESSGRSRRQPPGKISGRRRADSSPPNSEGDDHEKASLHRRSGDEFPRLDAGGRARFGQVDQRRE